MIGQKRVIIENLEPEINHGKFPAKRVINEAVRVRADILCDGHDLLGAELRYRFSGDREWQAVEMFHDVNDRWEGSFITEKLGHYLFTVSAWVDQFRSWHNDVLKKIEAGTATHVDLLVGAELINKTLVAYPALDATEKRTLNGIYQELVDEKRDLLERTGPVNDLTLYGIMAKYPLRDHESEYGKELEVIVEREKARFSSWYEVFPRSLSPEKGKHGTFRDCIRFLPYVKELGFDILYLPPVHPIGETNRKGKNNNRVAEPGDPGSPWAIGSKDGGHKAVHPELGTLKDFRDLVSKAAKMGIEVALDIAFQCSPDHPYIREHPEWFRKRPDGSLQYAENPPKKYEDIYPLNFESENWKELWEELKSVFLFWIEQGVKIFRVDNPHTKSIPFWGWVIGEVCHHHPDVIFLSEAFTRPKIMKQLAKQGFTQSYTYFTWRHTKYELTTYLNELVKTETGEYFRPNFWPNTPDILPEFLQVSGRTGFVQRLILAATMSSNYGIYGPAFELMENTPVAFGKEEYLNSEKYEIREWDTGNSKSLKKIIARLNTIRRENRALHNTRTLTFHDIENEALIAYSKISDDLSNIILVVVNLDPHHTHSGWVRIPLEKFDLEPGSTYQAHDLLSGSFYLWNGEYNYVEINPGVMPAHLFRIRRKVHSEKDFDYFM